MSWHTDSGALTGRAFRVHFRADADLAAGRCCGRVEHLRSGDALHFTTIQEFLSFVEFWLSRSAVGSGPRGHSGGPDDRSP
jgi:hypothetical protein